MLSCLICLVLSCLASSRLVFCFVVFVVHLSCLCLNFVLSLSRLVFLLSCLVLSCLVLFCFVLSCLVLSCLVFSCLFFFCLVLLGLVLSYLALSFFVLSLSLACLIFVFVFVVICVCLASPCLVYVLSSAFVATLPTDSTLRSLFCVLFCSFVLCPVLCCLVQPCVV
jgi:hypothetical protein